MAAAHLMIILGVLGCFVEALHASAGDVDPLYRTCVEQCQKTGYIGDDVSQYCRFSLDDISTDGPWYDQEPQYLRWKQWNCLSDCRYHCMMRREKERDELGLAPLKYHGKWPFKRVSLFQEPVSAALSAFNLIMHLHGWFSFSLLLHYKLPLRHQSKKAYYEYTTLWHVYGLLAVNAWFWSFVYHTREVDLTEKLDYSAAVAFLGYSLVLSILRTFSVCAEASRVMVAAPFLAFFTTHILYLNFYKLDYGLNMKVCVATGMVQLVLWAVWAGFNHHSLKIKVWTVVFGGGLAMLLEIYDFPPYGGYVDAHALWHATTVPLTYLWWRFVKDDAAFRTSILLKKTK